MDARLDGRSTEWIDLRLKEWLDLEEYSKNTDR